MSARAVASDSFVTQVGNALKTTCIVAAAGTGGVILGLQAGTVTVLAAIRIQSAAGGAPSLLGPATLGGTVIFNVVGTPIPLFAIGGFVVMTGVVTYMASRSIYNALS